MLDLDDLDDDTVINDVIPQDNPTEEASDTLLNAEVSINVSDKHILGTAKQRARGADGRPIGRRDNNPFLDTRMYEVRMPDRSSRELTYNVIAENLLSKCYSEGIQYQLISKISDHLSDDTAIKKGDKWIDTKEGKQRKITTHGWSFFLEWKDDN